LQIEIPDDELTALSEHAKSKLRSSTKEYVTLLIQEASRFEVAQRAGDANAEITESHVTDAGQYLNSRRRPSKPSQLILASRLISYVSAAFLGYGVSSLDTSFGQASFAGGVLVGAVSTVVEFLKEDR
jgi:hypothetical protein